MRRYNTDIKQIQYKFPKLLSIICGDVHTNNFEHILSKIIHFITSFKNIQINQIFRTDLNQRDK